MKITTLVILLSIYLFGVDELYTQSYWLKLLHYKDGESQMDDKRFFLSSNGKKSPKNELLATLDSIQNGKSNDINSTQCKFPARTRWLKEQLPQANIKECSHIKTHLKKFDFKTLHLVYASSYMNAPASMVGHTFLRFDRDEATPLLSYALNYSAQIDKNTTILSYAFDGLFGRFEGRYSIAPYYDMVRLYSNMERRDMWEYRLDFSPKEIERIVLHIIEVERYYSDYFFVSENCAYNLLWFIELAREELKFVDRFDYITVPLDTIKELHEAGLIKKSTFRPSKTTKINAQYSEIEDKKIAQEFLSNTNLSIIKILPKEQQRAIIDLYLLKNSDQVKVDILKYRSQLGIAKNPIVEATTNPIESNRASKLTLLYNRNHQLEYGFRVSYHDIYDLDYDFSEGSYISFFDFRMRDDRLQQLDLINVNSMPTEQGIYNPNSWGIEIGFRRDKDDKLQFNLKGKIGKSYKFLDTLLFWEPFLTTIDSKLTIGYDIGILKSINRVKFGLLANQNYDDSFEYEGFITYKIRENMALHLYSSKENNRFGLFYYF